MGNCSSNVERRSHKTMRKSPSDLNKAPTPPIPEIVVSGPHCDEPHPVGYSAAAPPNVNRTHLVPPTPYWKVKQDLKPKQLQQRQQLQQPYTTMKAEYYERRRPVSPWYYSRSSRATGATPTRNPATRSKPRTETRYRTVRRAPPRLPLRTPARHDYAADYRYIRSTPGGVTSAFSSDSSSSVSDTGSVYEINDPRAKRLWRQSIARHRAAERARHIANQNFVQKNPRTKPKKQSIRHRISNVDTAVR
ncbi:hypothetical protein P152DRAFT_487471 [Eremomyces bilateralis CBS 781.70]|uniref:Uncharacterized protein n=1 Tax=Eremomyces bilateralis CBS 781.70 TaxID=1392243 RepID=A0A6G1GHT2_9PEZI|nr:uncharacterized protein P152DRAFT_487471 [Eremomyces bilateralis CBS 781.70]KAF1817638.1 hypothetical protein P152DRAFT_487471 [Eremomyces bilateralis CBS 781.70]